jgi:hypothetical protein
MDRFYFNRAMSVNILAKTNMCNNGTTGLCNPFVGNGLVKALSARGNEVTFLECLAIT